MVRREASRSGLRLVDVESEREKREHLMKDQQVRAAHSARRIRRVPVKKIRLPIERAVVAFCAIVAFVGLFYSYAASKSTPDLTSRPFSTVSVTVAPGDTLWSLAQRYEDPALRPADRMDLIRQANPSLGSALAPGQTLLIPVTSSSMSTEIHLAGLPK